MSHKNQFQQNTKAIADKNGWQTENKRVLVLVCCCNCGFEEDYL